MAVVEQTVTAVVAMMNREELDKSFVSVLCTLTGNT